MPRSPIDLLKHWRSIEDLEFHVAENQLRPPPDPFAFLFGADLRRATFPPKTNVLGEGVITLGQLTTIIVQGGTGKSRVAMQVAITRCSAGPSPSSKRIPFRSSISSSARRTAYTVSNPTI